MIRDLSMFSKLTPLRLLAEGDAGSAFAPTLSPVRGRILRHSGSSAIWPFAPGPKISLHGGGCLDTFQARLNAGRDDGVCGAAAGSLDRSCTSLGRFRNELPERRASRGAF